MRKLSVLITILISVLLCSCPLNKKNETRELTIVSWNVQNIFNSVRDGYEYDEYLPASGWNQQAYEYRLNSASTVFSYTPISEADVIILNEVENDAVVEDLMNSKVLAKNGFIYYATAGESGGAIKTAVISRIPITEVRVHNINGVRPVLQVEIQSLYEKIIILAIHAKSNLDGVSQTAPKRLKLADMLKNIAGDIEKENPGSLIIIAGDFNESFSDNNMMCDARKYGNSCPLPLLPDFKTGYWYCPWLDVSNRFPAEGSYCYNNEWKCYDNILVSQAGKNDYGWEFDSAGAVFRGVLQTTDFKPNGFRRDLLSGVSDHLPVWIKLSLF